MCRTAAGMVDSGSCSTRCPHIPSGRSRGNAAQRDRRIEESHVRLCGRAGGNGRDPDMAVVRPMSHSWLSCLRRARARSNMGALADRTERGEASSLRGKAGIFRLRRCADRPKDVRGEAQHGRSDHHVGRQRHFRGWRRRRLVHTAHATGPARGRRAGGDRGAAPGRVEARRQVRGRSGRPGTAANTPQGAGRPGHGPNRCRAKRCRSKRCGSNRRRPNWPRPWIRPRPRLRFRPQARPR